MESNGYVTITSLDQGTPFVEAYGLLLASVLLGNDGKPPSVMAVAAARTGDGATTTALNLALMMARTGRPTAIVDANMRRPGLHKPFGVPQAPGLAEVLTGKADIKKTVLATKVPGLSVLPAGESAVPSQALLTQPALAGVFTALRERFDLIVVDTPPILQYSDALHIGKCVDGVLLVVSSQGASRRDQQEMRRLFERVETRILGSVLNRVRTRERVP